MSTNSSLDLVAVQDALSGHRRGQGTDLSVRSEPQPDELRGRQVVDHALLIRRKQLVEAESLLEANDAVLCAEREEAGVQSDHHQTERQ